jgi:hypothetical protein
LNDWRDDMDYIEMVYELLNIEERNDIFNLTRTERILFQSYVRSILELGDKTMMGNMVSNDCSEGFCGEQEI